MKLFQNLTALCLLAVISGNVSALELTIDALSRSSTQSNTSSTEGEGQALDGLQAIDVETNETDIMDIPMDGSNVESFTAGLERVEKEGSETQYRSIMSALSYMRFYDIGANREWAKVYANLDGLSPNEILQKVDDARNSK